MDGSRTCFNLWAPLVESVEIDIQGHRTPLEETTDGWWTLLADAGHGTRYAYLLDDHDVLLPDPASRWLPDGVHGHSAVLDPERLGLQSGTFQAPPLTSAVIYELHIGTFTPEGTFGAAVEHLADLVDLGVTHVEIMPVNAFDGVHGWGYDGVAWYAVHQPYGGPEGFAALIQSCHDVGLAVILDVVHNHLGPSGNYLPRFGPYLQNDAESTWGKVVNLDGPQSGPVRDFIIGNALAWLQDYQVDALRLDAVHALDDRGSATHVLAEMSQAVAALGERSSRHLALIAETDRNDPKTITPLSNGGQGMDAQWADDLHHAIHVAVTGETDGYYVDFADPLPALAAALTGGLVYDGSRYSAFRQRVVGAPVPDTLSLRRLVACTQNHDQVGNRAMGDRLTTQIDDDLVRLATVVLCAAPHTPMLFMGQEYGETRPFAFFSDMPDEDLRQAIRDGRRAEFAYFESWRGQDGEELGDQHPTVIPDPVDPQTFRASTLDRTAADIPAGRARRLLWHDLLRLRRTEPALGNGDQSLIDVVVDQRTLILIRRGPCAGGNTSPEVRLYLNLAETPMPGSDQATMLLSSADTRYGGPGHASSDTVPPRAAALFRMVAPTPAMETP